jgi:hypothetical protein
MEFDGSFGPPELSPIKHLQAQIDGARIHTDQSVFEPELSLSDFDLNPAPVKQLHEDMLIQFPGAVFIGIGQRGMARSRDAQVFQLPFAASKASGNLTEGMGSAQLAEKHRHKQHEGFGIAFIEAAAFGVPGVGSRAGGIPDAVLHGETGLLVPQESPEKLAEALMFLYRNPEKRKAMGEAGMKRAKSLFPARVIAARFCEEISKRTE